LSLRTLMERKVLMYQARGCHRLKVLALLLVFAGCAAKRPSGGSQWYGQSGTGTAQDFHQTASAGQQATDVGFEEATPQQAEELRQRGIQLPRSSHGLADPRAHRDFVDLRVTAVGFGITAGGYLLYCEGLPQPVFVPGSHVDLGLTNAEPLNGSIYPDRDTALADLAASARGARRASYAWYRGAGGALITPTVFSPASTPRIARTMLEVRKHLSETVERELKVVLLTLTGTQVLQGVFSRVVRMGSEPAMRPLARKDGAGGEAPAPRQPMPRPTETLEPASARGADLAQPRPPPVAVPERGKAGNPQASSRALREREDSPEAPLPALQQQIRDVLLKEHPGLHPRVATEAARGGNTVQGPGGAGGDVTLLKGGRREVSVHHGDFTSDALGGHLVKKASQDEVTEIYLQINSPGASREVFLRFVPKLRNAYEDLRGKFLRVFGPNGETWWSGSFGGP
jgi:hypothetical protein